MFTFIYAHDACARDDAYTRAFTCAYLLADGAHDGGVRERESAHVCMTHLYVSYSHVRSTRVHV